MERRFARRNEAHHLSRITAAASDGPIWRPKVGGRGGRALPREEVPFFWKSGPGCRDALGLRSTTATAESREVFVPNESIEPIAHICTPYPTKFGVPRQPGLVDALEAQVVFGPDYRNPDALRGLEGFDYVWLIWGFSHNGRNGEWSPTVRPPVLGGTRRMGVFATRSSFRPNGLGLSSVRLLGVEPDAVYPEGGHGPLLRVGGADMVDGTPVFDIKPYLPSWDSHPDARTGWRELAGWSELDVDAPPSELAKVPARLREGLMQMLRQDPRPAYARYGREGRVFWVPIANLAVRFTVAGSLLSVVDVVALDADQLARLRSKGSLEELEE